MRLRNLAAGQTDAPAPRTRSANAASDVTTLISDRTIIGADQPDDLVVSRIRRRLGRVMYLDRGRVNRRRSRLLENHGHQMGVRRSPPLKLFDEPDSRALTVLPPAIRTSPDDIHGVDDPAHNAEPTGAIATALHSSPPRSPE